MINSSICYIEKNNKYLMLNRNKKENDISKGKWIGVGGKFEKDESPEECIIREVKEETGLNIKSLSFRGIVTYVSNIAPTEYMYLFTSDDFEGEISECNEGTLHWIEKDKIFELNLWEGDKFFLKKLETDNAFFTMKLQYEGDNLIKYDINQY